ncbi:hypothetical protein Tsubulata_047916 [Turnera subulata]|uniref:Bifunctional inhibitor/plant lipid transfer protein/seed storage helical domain-containing protein n=1 Tax=Turnera subulata TaxID=218843 RepID=A0A9Q0G0P9_9ROSI|nr:hypothetical protein Tsubulata_047916 [Turnera subulata]
MAASLFNQPQNVIISFLVLLLVISISPTSHSQAPPIPSEPTVTGCTASLLPLAPCAPFVRGISPAPMQSCCDSLEDLYLDHPGCLCLLLNSTNLGAFPINTTLALELPARCDIDMNAAVCPGFPHPQLPGVPPASQVSLGQRTNSSSGAPTNSSIAASPVVQVSPRQGAFGFGFDRNDGGKFKADAALMLVETLAAIFLTCVIVWF